MCDSCNLFSRSNIKKGLRLLKCQEQTHAISIRHLVTTFIVTKYEWYFNVQIYAALFLHLLSSVLTRQRLCSSDQTNLPPTSKTQGRNPTTDSRQTDAALNCGWFFQPASCKLMRFLTSFHGHNNCYLLAWSSKNRNPVAHQNTQTPLLETTKPSDSCPWRYGGIGLIGRYYPSIQVLPFWSVKWCCHQH